MINREIYVQEGFRHSKEWQKVSYKNGITTFQFTKVQEKRFVTLDSFMG